MKIKLTAKVGGDGRLVSNRRGVASALADFAGKVVEITISKKRSTRSLDQNAYYWSCVVPIVKEGLKDAGTLLTTEDTHLALRAKFLSEPIADSDGLILADHIRSTTELTKSEFSDYIELIKQWSQDYLNTTIPEAGEQIELL